MARRRAGDPRARMAAAVVAAFVAMVVPPASASTNSSTSATASSNNLAGLEISPGTLVVDYLPGGLRPGESMTSVPATRGGQRRTAAATATRIGDFTACFSEEVPADIRPAALEALASWDDALELAGPTIEVDIYWSAFGNDGALAASGPQSFVRDDNLPVSTVRYPVALANQLLQVDANPRQQCDLSQPGEIVVYINSTVGGDGSRWHRGDSPPPEDKIDLETVLTHEMAHGLGFITSAHSDNGTLAWENSPTIYDQLLGICPGSPACDRLELTPAFSSTASLTSDRVWMDVADAELLQAFAPAEWDGGSSISHFDEYRYDDRGPLRLMTPYVARGEEHDQVDFATLAVLQSMGWPVAVVPAAPLEMRIESGNGQVHVAIEPSGLAQSSAASSYAIEVWRDGSLRRTDILAADSGTVEGLSNGAGYRFAARARTAGGPSAATSLTAIARPLELPPYPTAEYLIDDTFQRFVGRAPTSAEVASNLAALRQTQHPSTPAELIAELMNASEVRYQTQVVRLYLGFFDRQPDSDGLAFWIGRGQRGERLERTAQFFATATEFEQGAAVSDHDFASETYRRVLGREPEAAGLRYWEDRLADGLRRGRMLLLFSESVEHRAASQSNSEITVLFWSLLDRQPTATELRHWIPVLNAEGSAALIEELVRSDELATTITFN